MSYMVKEIFLTHQGEGANIGRLAVFIRFSGCNLWSGREQDRLHAVCKFCDTDFVGGKRYTAVELVAEAVALFPIPERRFVVLTGGEPLLQVDNELLDYLRIAKFTIAVETNGTKPLPGLVDWVCVSPKARTKLVLTEANELKLVYPQQGAAPELFSDFIAEHRWLSPRAATGRAQRGDRLAANTRAATTYCRAHPEWRLAIQAHKFWGIR
jgi:7-carboxy-7-deazaguanine synthase (Cx14CxxC type)